jgi:hypothetical protein
MMVCRKAEVSILRWKCVPMVCRKAKVSILRGKCVPMVCRKAEVSILRGKCVPSATWSSTIPTWTDLKLNPDPPRTNCLGCRMPLIWNWSLLWRNKKWASLSGYQINAGWVKYRKFTLNIFEVKSLETSRSGIFHRGGRNRSSSFKWWKRATCGIKVRSAASHTVCERSQVGRHLPRARATITPNANEKSSSGSNYGHVLAQATDSHFSWKDSLFLWKRKIHPFHHRSSPRSSILNQFKPFRVLTTEFHNIQAKYIFSHL